MVLFLKCWMLSLVIVYSKGPGLSLICYMFAALLNVYCSAGLNSLIKYSAGPGLTDSYGNLPALVIVSFLIGEFKNRVDSE
jgi:hypothetical protein